MSQPTLSIPQDVIQPIIQANISAAIIQALGERSKIMEQAIASILSVKVDSEGKPGSYNSNQPWIDWALGNTIRQAAKEAITEYLAGNKDQIKAALAAELSKKNSPLVKQLLESMVAGMTSPDTLRYGISLTVSQK